MAKITLRSPVLKSQEDLRNLKVMKIWSLQKTDQVAKQDRSLNLKENQRIQKTKHHQRSRGSKKKKRESKKKKKKRKGSIKITLIKKIKKLLSQRARARETIKARVKAKLKTKVKAKTNLEEIVKEKVRVEERAF